jgi:hypothetical protein
MDRTVHPFGLGKLLVPELLQLLLLLWLLPTPVHMLLPL